MPACREDVSCTDELVRRPSGEKSLDSGCGKGLVFAYGPVNRQEMAIGKAVRAGPKIPNPGESRGHETQISSAHRKIGRRSEPCDLCSYKSNCDCPTRSGPGVAFRQSV